MSERPEVIVAGVGAVGSAALWQLARQGIRALGLDPRLPPHDHGSSHGETRITRVALGEGEVYVPFVRRAHELWRALEEATGETLFRQIGGLIYGPAGGGGAHGVGDFLARTIEVARSQSVAHEILDARALAARFPALRLGGDELGYFEPSAGILHPEACIRAQLDLAQRAGARLSVGERLVSFTSTGDRVLVETDRGRHEAGGLILTAGAWLPGLSQGAVTARVYRQVLFWFEPEGPAEWFGPDRLPVYIRIPGSRGVMFYGFPVVPGGTLAVKVAGEQLEESAEPDAIDDRVSAEEIRGMFEHAAPHLRLTERCVRTAVCKYTVTSDFRFRAGPHPEHPRVWLASACSGHGFKHSAAIGEALAELAAGGRSTLSLEPFAPSAP